MLASAAAVFVAAVLLAVEDSARASPFLPLLAVLLALPVIGRSRRFVGVSLTVAAAAWAVGWAAFSVDLPDAAFFLPFGLALCVAALEERRASGRAAGVGALAAAALGVAAVVVSALRPFHGDVVIFAKLLLVVGCARLLAGATRRSGGPLPVGGAAAIFVAAGIQAAVLAALPSFHTAHPLLSTWADIAAASVASVATLLAVRRAGLSRAGLVMAAALCVPAFFLAATLAMPVFADFGGALPAAVQASLDAGLAASANGGVGWIAATTSLPLALLAVAGADRRRAGVVVALHGARVALCCATPHALAPSLVLLAAALVLATRGAVSGQPPVSAATQLA